MQSGTFMCAELQCRYMTRVFKGLIDVPSLDEQYEDMERTRNTLAARFIDRQQLRVQHGIDGRYYQDLAYEIGCEPTPWRLLTERPTAFWHALFTNTGQIRNRLVGPGRLENAELWAEERYHSRHFGFYMDAGGEYDHNPMEGKPRNGDGNGPVNRRSWSWPIRAARGWYAMGRRLIQYGKEGNVVGPIPFLQRPQQIKDHHDQNLRYAELDATERGIEHSLQLNAEVQDGYLNAGGERGFAFADRASVEGGGLVEDAAEQEVAADASE